LLDEEIKLCQTEIDNLYTAKVQRFRESVSEDAEKISFRLFQFERELNNMPESRSIALLGRLRGDPTDAKAIAVLSKKEFSSEHMQELNKSLRATEAEEYFHNSIFRKYWLQLSAAKSDLNHVQCNFIYPATEMLIAKHSRQQYYTVAETPDTYNKVTRPQYVDKLDPGHVEWMHNVLDGKKETELCLFENEHFKLQKDYKFNEGDLKTMYCLAMPLKAREQKLASVRDLTAEHLPMLKSVREESLKAIEAKYGLPRSKVVAYFHYLPSYWLLHVHFQHMDYFQGMTQTRNCIALDTVISNLEIASAYFKKCTLVYPVGAQHDLCKVLMAAGVIEEYVEPEPVKPEEPAVVEEEAKEQQPAGHEPEQPEGESQQEEKE
jgi:m7GpppX diphosphatase